MNRYSQMKVPQMKMKSIGCRSSLLLITVTGLFADVIPSVARADTEVSLASTNIAGVTCATISYDCIEPSAVQVYLGTTLIIDYESDGDVVTAPRYPCFDESQFGTGPHTLTVDATCGTTTTSDSVVAAFSNPSVALFESVQDQYSWSTGDTVEVLLVAQSSGLTLAVDFSAVDTGYTSGDEVVTDIGGGLYQVQYGLTSTNTTGPGTYTLPVQITDGTVTRTHWNAIEVRYTPDPAGTVTIHDDNGGDFVIGEFPTGTLGSVGPVTNSFTIDPQPGAVAQLSGEIWSSASLDGQAVLINVREMGTGGFAATEVWIEDSVCGLTSPTCFAYIDVPLAIRSSKLDDVDQDDDLSLEMSLGLYFPSGPNFTGAIGLPDWTLDKAPPNNIMMKGRLTYQQLIQSGTPNPEHVLHPQVGTLSLTSRTAPVRRATIEISDTCSHTYKTQTQEDGSWAAWVPKQCTNKDYTVRAKPVTTFGMFNVATRDGNDQTHVSTIGTANIPGSSHDWGSKHYGHTDIEYGEFSTFMAGIRVQEWAKPYLVGDGKVNLFPALFFKFVAGQDAPGNCAGTSCYSGQTITVGAGAKNPDHKDEWTLAHESYHWFQDMFMAKFDGNAGSNAWAGAFGEGFASMMQRELLTTTWVFKMFEAGVGEAENPDFQGNFKEAGGVKGNWKEALPLDLYAVTGDQGSGGWSWRILSDFFDGSETEVHGTFTRYTSDGAIASANPTMTNFGTAFDTVGSAAMFQDVIVRYLGGHFMPANASRPDLDSRGEVGLDMTEFLDGILCRGHEDWVDMEPLVLDMMDFQAYDPNSGPPSCP